MMLAVSNCKSRKWYGAIGEKGGRIAEHNGSKRSSRTEYSENCLCLRRYAFETCKINWWDPCKVSQGDLITLKTLAYGSMVLLAPSTKIEYTTITGDNPQQAVLCLAAEFFLKGCHEGHFKLKDISFDDGNDSSASSGLIMYEKHIAKMTRC